MPDTSTQDTALHDLTQTADALDAGVTSMYPKTAMASIAHWEAQCREAGVVAVADGLVTLRDALSQDRLDGRAIGRALLDLAEATDAAAPADNEPLASTLGRVATGLRRAGTSLGGAKA
ncbi:MAG: hypothetical protein AAF089_06965 [Bacteroidota bacterium]